MSLISTLEHSFAVAAQDIVKASKFVAEKVVPALRTAQAAESTIEAVTALVNPAAVNIERQAFDD